VNIRGPFLNVGPLVNDASSAIKRKEKE